MAALRTSFRRPHASERRTHLWLKVVTTTGLAAAAVLLSVATAEAQVVCTTATPTVTTAAELDAAIACYNAQTPAGDHTITIDGTINHATGTPTIAPTAPTPSRLTINGVNNATLTGPGPDSLPGGVDLITVNTTAEVNINNLTVNGADDHGIRVEGTIAGFERPINTTISNGMIHNNGASGVFVNGAVATVTISQTILHNNDFAGVDVDSVDTGLVTITDSTIHNNGDGVRALSAAIAVSDSTLHSNGDGVFQRFGSTLITNSTIHNNARGIDLNDGGRTGTVTVSNTTITDNTIFGISQAGVSFEVASSIVANNGTDCLGTISNPVANFASNPASCGAGFTQLSAGSLDPAGLADNGCTAVGCTQTVALLPGSNAFGGGLCAASLLFDQRGPGFPRTNGLHCDAGAFEAEACPTTVPVQTTVTSAIALDEAIACYNAQTPAGDHTITIDGTISHPGGTPTIAPVGATPGDLVIEGGVNNPTLAGPGADSLPSFVDLFHVNSTAGTTFDKLTIDGADADGIQVDAGTVTVTNTTITNNTGGAGVVGSGGSTTVTNTTIADNAIGVFVGTASVTVANSTVANNPQQGIFVLPLSGGFTNVVSTIVANNGTDCSGVTTAASSFASDTSCGAGFTQLSAGSLDPAGLGDNGGPTRTIALVQGSNAIDAGSCAGLPFDQRGAGFPRTIGGNCDAGAYEVDACTNATTTVDTSTELDFAIGCYNAQTPAGDHTITIDGTINHPTGTPTISPLGATPGNLTIDGINNATLMGPGADSLSGFVDLITIQTFGTDTTIQNVTINGADHDAIHAIEGFVTVARSTIANNGGDGIYANTAELTITDTTIHDNDDAGVSVEFGSAAVINSTLANNTDGVFVQDTASASVFNSTIVNNTRYGIGLDLTGTADATSSILAGNGFADCLGTITNSGANFDADASCSFIGLSAGSLDPAGLADNGGPTQTVALVDGSNAIDAGSCAGLQFDQRGPGFPRTNGVNCDAGAFEAPEPGAGYVAVTPVRIIDSRSAPTLNIGPFNTPWGAGQTRTIDATTALSGIPNSATAIAAHVTTVNGDPVFSWLTIYPTDDANPPLGTASINYGTTDLSTVITNDLIITKIDADGNFNVYNETGQSDLVIDIVGYYTTSNPAAADYVPVTPERIIDSRPAPSLNTGPYNTQWAAAQSRTINATAASNVPAGVTAVAVHVTTVNPDAASSWLTIHPTGTTRPTAASINYGTADVHTPITNDLVITGVDANGNFEIYNAGGNVDLVIDIVGYYTTTTTDPAAGKYVPRSPQRIIDSRPDASLNTGPYNTPWGPNTQRNVTATAPTNIPATATAVAVQITTIGATDPFSWLTTHPTGTTLPTAASINYGTATITAPITNDLIITGIDTNGNFTIHNETGQTNIIIDIVGYYD